MIDTLVIVIMAVALNGDTAVVGRDTLNVADMSREGIEMYVGGLADLEGLRHKDRFIIARRGK